MHSPIVLHVCWWSRVCCLFIIFSRPFVVAEEKPLSITEIKKVLLTEYELSPAPKDSTLADLKRRGDLFAAAAEILKENEKSCNPAEDRWGIAMTGLWKYAFTILERLGTEGDLRVGQAVFPYLSRPFKPGLPDVQALDDRWLESHRFMIKVNDPEGCRYIRERIQGAEAGPEEKRWMIGLVNDYGSLEWLPFLKSLRLSPAELSSEERVGIELDVTIRNLEKRSTGGKGPSNPPAGAGPSPGNPDRSPGSASNEPVHAVPATAQSGNAVVPLATSSSSSPAWLRLAAAALFLCALVAGAAALLRRRARPR